MRDFWRAIKSASIDKKLTVLAVGFSFAYTLIGLIFPLILKGFFDMIEQSLRAGTSGSIPSQYYLFLAGLVAVLFAQDFIGQGTNYYITKWWTVTRQILQLKVFSHLESLSLGYFEKNSTGKIKERVDSGIRDLNNIMEGAIIDIAPQILFIFFAAVILFRINYIFGLAIIISAPLFTIISYYFAPKLIKTQDKIRSNYERLGGLTTESILNIKTIKSYATEKHHYNKISRRLSRIIFLEMKYIVTRIFMNILRFFIVNLSQTVILGLGVYWALVRKDFNRYINTCLAIY